MIYSLSLDIIIKLVLRLQQVTRVTVQSVMAQFQVCYKYSVKEKENCRSSFSKDQQSNNDLKLQIDNA